MQKVFLWENSTPKIKQDTLCNGYKGEGRKDIGISNEIMRQHKLHENSYF